MLRTSDLGASKNACFALSCLASSNDGHARLVGNSDFYHLLSVTSELLHAEDSETGWFAAMYATILVHVFLFYFALLY